MRDYTAIERLVAQRSDVFRQVAPQAITQLDVRFEETTLRKTIVGTTERFREIQSAPIAHGRFMTADDNARHAPVIVLGSELAAELIGGGSETQAAAIGAIVEVNGQPLRIAGILATSRSIFGLDEQALVPINTLRRRLANSLEAPGRGTQLGSVLIGLQSEQQVDQVEPLLRASLRAARGVPQAAIDDFQLILPTSQLGVLAGINGAVTGFVAVVALTPAPRSPARVVLRAAERRGPGADRRLDRRRQAAAGRRPLLSFGRGGSGAAL
jgi:putative ABC transport system permease protein